ncbi:MAG: hypothetical protein V4485_04030 [Pseudomonadota bacterium]
MIKALKIGLLSLGFISILPSYALAEDCGCAMPQTPESTQAPENKFYVGIEGGASMPLKQKFDIKDKESGLKSKAKLSRSAMYGAIVGYKFYPEMAFELAFQRKPLYKAKVTTPATTYQAPGITLAVPSASNTVKITSDIYMAGITYNLAQVGALTPYIGFDAGVARVKAKGASIKAPIATPVGVVIREVMEIKKTSCTAPAWQLTLGASTQDLIPNTQLYMAARVQAIHNVKLKYSMDGGNTKTFKKTLGVGEVVLGMTYALPF